MRNYGQFCPIARASELLAERWTLIILRNLLIGCRTFNEIADGAPGLSRGLLSKRLQEFERAGVIEIRPKSDGPGSTYEPTQAGRELWDVMLALQQWGSRWTELTPEHAHPGLVLWSWVWSYLPREGLPRRRVLVRFDFTTLTGPGRRGWLLIEHGDGELCEKYPGGEEDLVVLIHDPVAFARWHLGELKWGDACAPGRSRCVAPRRWPAPCPPGTAGWNRRRRSGQARRHPGLRRSGPPGTTHGHRFKHCTSPSLAEASSST